MSLFGSPSTPFRPGNIGAGVNQQQTNISKDIEVPQVQNDSISSLCFNPKANILSAASWNNEVRIWDIAANGSVNPIGMFKHDAPVLCTRWSSDGARCFSASCDKTAKAYDMNTKQCVQVAQHDAPIKSIEYSQEMNSLITGSWDNTVRYWDTRTNQPQLTVNQGERVYTMSLNGNLLVVGLAERQIAIYDLKNPQQPYRKVESPLKVQTRCVSTFPNKGGFIIGGVQGRCTIHFIEEKDDVNNFCFKAHRQSRSNNVTDIYPVNEIQFNAQGTFATCGADGSYSLWDKESRQRLLSVKRSDTPISSIAYNSNGTIFAYALSYDWSKGVYYFNKNNPNRIFLHAFEQTENLPLSMRKK